MNTAIRFRIGRRSLKRGRGRRLNRYTTRMLGGARRPRINHLGIALKLLNQYVSRAERLARKDPDQFDPATVERNCFETLRQRERELEFEAALLHVYGPDVATAQRQQSN